MLVFQTTSGLVEWFLRVLKLLSNWKKANKQYEEKTANEKNEDDQVNDKDDDGEVGL